MNWLASSQPSAAEAEALARTMLSGSWNVAELPHRCSQMYIEEILWDEAQRLETVTTCFGHRVNGFRDLGSHVEVDVGANTGKTTSYTARYLVGADGARSTIRDQLGIEYRGLAESDRFFTGLMYSIYFKAPEMYRLLPHRPAWQYWAVNRERRGLMLALDGHGEFVLLAQPHADERPLRSQPVLLETSHTQWLEASSRSRF